MKTSYYIVYISPNGSTRKVAEVLALRLNGKGAAVEVADLASGDSVRLLLEKMRGDERACLFIGSPVYRNLAVPPVMAFIQGLPAMDGLWAVPFVTYGLACSGIALWQMAKALQAKGIGLAGAAKVAALHALTWHSDDPVGKNRPDPSDLHQVEELADRLSERFAVSEPQPLPLETLDYQPDSLTREWKTNMNGPWTVIGKSVDHAACTACGICEQHCPASAIRLDPAPVFGATCFGCCNCIRLCPEEAIRSEMDLAKLETMIRNRVKTINERPLTGIFLG